MKINEKINLKKTCNYFVGLFFACWKCCY